MTEEVPNGDPNASPEGESLDVLFKVLKGTVYNKVQGRSAKLESLEKSLSALGDAARRIVNKETPRTEADLLAEVTAKASEAAFNRLEELIQPLVETVGRLEARKREED